MVNWRRASRKGSRTTARERSGDGIGSYRYECGYGRARLKPYVEDPSVVVVDS